MGKQRASNMYQRNVNKANNRKVRLYEKYEKKQKKIDNYIEEQEEKIHPYMVRKYGDVDLRKEIINEAIENNYPEEALGGLQLYADITAKWDLNVSDNILEKFEELQLYNKEAKRQKGFIRLFLEKMYYIFHQGGDSK